MKITFLTFLISGSFAAFAQNPLPIPASLTGPVFNLTIQSGTQNFYGTPTPTYGINGPFLGPTLIVNKGDSITLHVTNNLNVETTMHWHGMHVPARFDGGPHQSILPGTTWSPSFKILNRAGTCWYHPHGAGRTEQHVSKGLAGMFIIRDSAEGALVLPRTYGVDDIPVIVQTKAFDILNQIAIATDMDTALFVNGAMDPYFNAPAQVLRFRLLNGSSMRTFNFGFSNGQSFYQIATDGGLKDSSLELTRLVLSPGERAEILIDFSGMTGQTIYLRSFSSELPAGIYGSGTVGMGADTIEEYSSNFLNGADFDLLRLDITTPTGSSVTTIPVSLVPFTPFSPDSANNYRTIVLDTIRLLPIDPPNRAAGPFGMNNRVFNMDSINEVIHLNTTEIWTLKNNTLIAHPIHLHDIQFNVIEKSGTVPSATERGWKDVVLVPPGDSVKIITRFETFADDSVPYMFHCHLLHHEDDGMMGSFVVIDTTTTGISEINPKNQFAVYPNPVTDELHIRSITNSRFYICVYDIAGKLIYSDSGVSTSALQTAQWESGLYFLHIRQDGTSLVRKIIKE